MGKTSFIMYFLLRVQPEATNSMFHNNFKQLNARPLCTCWESKHPFCECTVQWCKSWHLQEIIGRAGIWKVWYCNCPSAMVLYSVLYSCMLKILQRTHMLRNTSTHVFNTFKTKQTKPHNAVNYVIVSECVLAARHVPVFIHVLGLLH